MAGKRRNLIAGAIAGAALVAIPAVLFGELIRDVAHPALIVAFVLLGAVLGAYAWGVVAYQREHLPQEPTAAYREGVLAEPEPEPEPGDEPAQDGLLWLARRRAASLLKLPLNPWI